MKRVDIEVGFLVRMIVDVVICDLGADTADVFGGMKVGNGVTVMHG